MAPKLHARRRHRPHRLPATESDESASSEHDVSVVDAAARQHLTTPRTKRRSITHLNELVRRQNEEHHTRAEQAAIGKQIDNKMESLLNHHEPPLDESSVAQRLIQVAVRCRPRQSNRRGQRRESDDEFGDDSSGAGSDDDVGESTMPSDSIVEYDIPAERDSKTLPGVSVPSHVLALGGHGPRRRFDFDFVFPPGREQREVYRACAYDAIEDVLRSAQEDDPRGDSQGAHATVVAYGQTGTGKTYTMGMLQHADPTTEDEEHGIIPRAIIHILSRITAFNRSGESQGRRTRLVASISFLQIYLESIQDLLAPGGRRGSHLTVQSPAERGSSQSSQGSSGGLQVRLDPATNMFCVPGLSEFTIEHVDDARALLERAAHNRVLAATARNKTSSRSHTLLTISIRHRRAHDEGNDAPDGHTHSGPRATVSFVDLAGSERVEGALHFLHATRKRQELRIREAKFINRSLSALGSVIAALSAQDGRRRRARSRSRAHGSPQGPASPRPSVPHIRFRDSQLTKLLQSRLMKGNGRLVLIATIDDQPANLTETLSTLKFASQCRRVDLSQRQSKADVLRKQREESLLKQVFAEVKVMYEEREAALEREYKARIAHVEEQLERLKNERQRLPATSPRRNAPYVALCSLADIASRRDGKTAPVHPSVEVFTEESELVTYTAELYRQVKTALVSTELDRRSPDRVLRKSLSALPDGSSTLQAGKQKSRESVIKDLAASKSRPTAHQEANVRPPEMTTRQKPQADDSEFQTMARLLFASGVIQSMDLSSDEDDGSPEPYSQLK